MNGLGWLLLLVPVVAILGILVGYLAHKAAVVRTIGDAETRSTRILDDAKRTVEQARVDVEARVREAEARSSSAASWTSSTAASSTSRDASGRSAITRRPSARRKPAWPRRSRSSGASSR